MGDFSVMLDDAFVSVRDDLAKEKVLKPSQIRKLLYDGAVSRDSGTDVVEYFRAEAPFFKDFLTKMTRHNMPGSKTFRLVSSKEYDRRMKAYEIGRRGSFLKRWALSSGDRPGWEYSTLIWNRIVYICEDGKLREQHTLFSDEGLHNLIVGDEFEIGKFLYVQVTAHNEKQGTYPVDVIYDFEKMNIRDLLVEIAAKNLLSTNLAVKLL